MNTIDNDMTLQQAIDIFLNRGIDKNNLYQGGDWRMAVIVISNALIEGRLIINEHD